jgi:hypothetical protein
MKKSITPVIGLRTATADEIKSLKLKYPCGEHVTHLLSGQPLPFNGLFITNIKF